MKDSSQSDASHDHAFMHPRYARQHVLRELGMQGQEKLARARVLIVGAGGLGSPAAMYLAAAGIGTIGLADEDVVDESNLHRQLLYGMSNVGERKLDAAQQRLRDINPLVNVTLHHERIRATNARAIIAGYDIVVDGTDNFPARYAINDACVALGIPFVYGSVARFEGQVSVFAAPDAPCYRCIFPDEPAAGTVPNCAEDGVLGVLPGIIGLYQSTEVIKYIAGIGRTLAGRLLMLDLLDHASSEIALARNLSCPACGAASTRISVAATPHPSASHTASPTASRPMPETAPEIDVVEVSERLKRGDGFVLLDVREPWEFEAARLPDAVLVPLSTLPSEVNGLDMDREYVVYCHHGMRSAMAANWLKSRGFEHVHNMTGGIDAWSVNVDRSVPRY
ncbi:MAG: molybdopterin-synthase adenylyltransferase MoeB [Gemmatimonas sp.]